MVYGKGIVRGNTVMVDEIALDEYEGKDVFVTIESVENKSGRGMAHEYANENLLAEEKQAFENALGVSDNGIFLSPVKENPRQDWVEAFREMHKNHDDVLDNIPDSEAFEWKM